jgi:HlyD family secretion protein
MSVTAEIETQYRTNVVTVPIASVTTRPPLKNTAGDSETTDDAAEGVKTNQANPEQLDPDRRERKKAVEVVFVVDGDTVKQAEVEIGISDDDYWEITKGLEAGVEIVTGGYRAISRELQDGSKIVKEKPVGGKSNPTDPTDRD